MDMDMIVPQEYAAEIKKLFPKEPSLGLMLVLKKGLSRVNAERRFTKKQKAN
jgi:hypothetical protein